MNSFKIEVRSDFPEWSRYNVFLTAVCFVGESVESYVNGDFSLVTPPCDRVELYVYVVAREFPSSDMIAASPPFDIQLYIDDKPTTYQVNQFGGLAIKQEIKN